MPNFLHTWRKPAVACEKPAVACDMELLLSANYFRKMGRDSADSNN